MSDALACRIRVRSVAKSGDYLKIVTDVKWVGASPVDHDILVAIAIEIADINVDYDSLSIHLWQHCFSGIAIFSGTVAPVDRRRNSSVLFVFVSANQQVRISVVIDINQFSSIYPLIIDGRWDSVCVLLEIAIAIVYEEERIIRDVRDENVEITILVYIRRRCTVIISG